jgi:PTS system nitrogen regulatory IIA component
MRERDFDIDSLAAFLHVLPVQVARLADRGKLPGRKVGGQWRFSPAEIHLWMEQRIGLSDDHQLEKMEQILEQSARPAADGPVVVGELLTPNTLAVPLRAKTRGSAILEMTRLAAQTGLLWDPGKMAQALRDREEMHPTALDNGVALLHPRRPMPSILGEPLLALGITRQGIPFGAGCGVLTDVFFLICSEDDRSHLRILARVSRMITAPGFLPAIRQAKNAETVHALISEYEAKFG